MTYIVHLNITVKREDGGLSAGGRGRSVGRMSSGQGAGAVVNWAHRVGRDARVVVDGEHVSDLVVGQLLLVACVPKAAHV